MHRFDARRRAFGLAIAGLAGFVDAAGFLASKSYFVSFMSGNTTRLGVDLTTDAAQAIVPVLLIAGFVAGVTAGALAARRFAGNPKSAVCMLTLVLLVAAAASRSNGSEPGFLAGAVLGMGAINNVFRHHGDTGIGLTYMTGALVRFGQGLADALAGDSRPGWLINLALWLSLAIGAACGAIAALHDPVVAAWLSVFFCAALTVAARLIERTARA